MPSFPSFWKGGPLLLRWGGGDEVVTIEISRPYRVIWHTFLTNQSKPVHISCSYLLSVRSKGGNISSDVQNERSEVHVP